MITLHHPQHGTKVAYVEREAELDEMNGWTRDGVPMKESSRQSAFDGLDIEELRELYRSRKGAYPHHRMKAETIVRELQE